MLQHASCELTLTDDMTSWMPWQEVTTAQLRELRAFMRQQEERAAVLGGDAGSEDDDDADPGLLSALAARAMSQSARGAAVTPGSAVSSQRGSQHTSQQVRLGSSAVAHQRQCSSAQAEYDRARRMQCAWTDQDVMDESQLHCHPYATHVHHVVVLQEAAQRLQAHQAALAARSERECADILACSGELDATEAVTDAVEASHAARVQPRYTERAFRQPGSADTEYAARPAYG